MIIFPLHAQESSEPMTEELAEMVVIADREPPPTLGALSMQSFTSVSEEVLQRNASGTLGETLGWEPGVSSGYFGPGASRPVIRGFEGVRVRMLRDDLGTFDLSDLSPDHGVTLEPFLLESVEIHRGPASLLYGSSAIGGAVNARSKVIARERPARPVAGGWESRYETNGEGLSGAGFLSLTEGPLVFRLTGSARDSGDISIPGRGRSAEYELTENPRVYDPMLGQAFPVENESGVLPNSFHEGSSWSAGISNIPENQPLLLGFSYSRFDSRYGVPYFFPGDATDLFGNYALEMVQDRFDLEGKLEFNEGFVSKIEARAAYGAYGHGEYFEGRGKDRGRDFLDTRLEKNGVEGRVDCHHLGFEGLTGIVGISAESEDLDSLRTIFPPPDLQRVNGNFESNGAGIYFLETFARSDWTARFGHRLETTRVADLSLESEGYTPAEREIASSLSASLAWERSNVVWLDRLNFTGILSRVERIPTATERYAFWNNGGIGRFLVGGDLDGTPLSLEKSTGYEMSMEAAKGPVTFHFNGYHYDFEHFIFLQEAPELTGGFGRAVQYIGRAASFTGFETGVDWKLNEPLTFSIMGDYVHAQNTEDREPIPRMPPFRIGSRLEWSNDRVTAGLEVRHATGQDRVKPAPRAELPAASYTMINADISRTFSIRGQDLTVFLRATNLLDQEARLATSFRKDVAPSPGRSLTLGLRGEF